MIALAKRRAPAAGRRLPALRAHAWWQPYCIRDRACGKRRRPAVGRSAPSNPRAFTCGRRAGTQPAACCGQCERPTTRRPKRSLQSPGQALASQAHTALNSSTPKALHRLSLLMVLSSLRCGPCLPWPVRSPRHLVLQIAASTSAGRGRRAPECTTDAWRVRRGFGRNAPTRTRRHTCRL